VPIDADEMGRIFTRLRLRFEQSGEEAFAGLTAVIPLRSEIEEDLIEEIARVYGFDNIPALPPLARAAMQKRAEDLALAARTAGTSWLGWIIKKSSTSASSSRNGSSISPATRIRSGCSIRSPVRIR
jgi:hypothetical protein